MKTSLKKLNKLLPKNPDIVSSSENSSEIEVKNSNLETRTTGSVEAKTNTIIWIPSNFTEEIYLPVYPANIIVSNIPRDCKVVKKQDCLPDLFSLKLVEANYKADEQLEKRRAISGYLGGGGTLMTSMRTTVAFGWTNGRLFPSRYADPSSIGSIAIIMGKPVSLIQRGIFGSRTFIGAWRRLRRSVQCAQRQGTE